MTRDCWDNFVKTGRVSDYLKYREQACSVGHPSAAAAWTDGVTNGPDDRSDRHGAVGNACR